jgi:hypothetical protein
VKTPSPIASVRRRPIRSPSAAPVRSSTANVSVYALTVHSSPSRLACRSVRITGIAVETTRLSSVVMKTAVEVIANVQSSFEFIVVLLRLSLSASNAAATLPSLRRPGVFEFGKPAYWS